MATTRGYLLPALAGGDELEAVSLTEIDRRMEDDTYTPTLTASGGTPAIGASGFLTGWWSRIGLDMDVWIDINLAGAGISLVGTSWRVGLPKQADLTRHSAGILAADSDAIGTSFWASGTAAQSLLTTCILSAAAELIFYASGSSTSRGSGDFTTSGRIKAHVRYKVAASEFS
jgi:hypothetical protein